VNALQAVRHKFRPFTHTQLIACDICDKVMAGKIGLKCEGTPIQVFFFFFVFLFSFQII